MGRPTPRRYEVACTRIDPVGRISQEADTPDEADHWAGQLRALLPADWTVEVVDHAPPTD